MGFGISGKRVSHLVWTLEVRDSADVNGGEIVVGRRKRRGKRGI